MIQINKNLSRKQLIKNWFYIVTNLRRCHNSHFLEKIFHTVFKKHLGPLVSLQLLRTIQLKFLIPIATLATSKLSSILSLHRFSPQWNTEKKILYSIRT